MITWVCSSGPFKAFNYSKDNIFISSFTADVRANQNTCILAPFTEMKSSATTWWEFLCKIFTLLETVLKAFLSLLTASSSVLLMDPSLGTQRRRELSLTDSINAEQMSSTWCSAPHTITHTLNRCSKTCLPVQHQPSSRAQRNQPVLQTRSSKSCHVCRHAGFIKGAEVQTAQLDTKAAQR